MNTAYCEVILWMEMMNEYFLFVFIVICINLASPLQLCILIEWQKSFFGCHARLIKDSIRKNPFVTSKVILIVIAVLLRKTREKYLITHQMYRFKNNANCGGSLNYLKRSNHFGEQRSQTTAVFDFCLSAERNFELMSVKFMRLKEWKEVKVS